MLEQKQVIPEYIPAFSKFDPFDDQALSSIPLDFPFWIKPIKSTASQLDFRITNRKEFKRAVAILREKIGLFKPFDYLLDILPLPEEIATVNSSYCVAERIISGRQCTLEGSVHNGQVRTYGIIDSIREPSGQPDGAPGQVSAMPDIADLPVPGPEHSSGLAGKGAGNTSRARAPGGRSDIDRTHAAANPEGAG